MALVLYRNALLKIGSALASGAACCCRLWCSVVGTDECGNLKYGCTSRSDNAIRPCDSACQQPAPPCECGPSKPCDVCYECIDQKCERIEDCCEDGGPCPPCFKCENGRCVPCSCCDTCIDGYCYPCDFPNACISCVCVPPPPVQEYYCCWDECPTDEDGDPIDPPPDTTCKPATYSGGVPQSPCGTATVAAPGGGTGTQECSLTKGGPYGNSNACNENCRNYDCKPNACGFLECEPDPDGPYDSLSECRDSCPEDPCASPPNLALANTCPSGNFPLPGAVTSYSIDACARTICVSYVSTNGRPIRVQIIAPTLDQDCEQIAVSVKSDSGWRCEECCDCPDEDPRSNSPGDCEGGPTGKITWNKPTGVQWFCVHVLSACNATYNTDVKVGASACNVYDDDDWEPCACVTDENCNDGCFCCEEKCRETPCGCEPGCEGCDVKYPNGMNAIAFAGPDCDFGFGFASWGKRAEVFGPYLSTDARYAGWLTPRGVDELNDCILYEIDDYNIDYGSAYCGICAGAPYTSNCAAERIDRRRRLFKLDNCAGPGAPTMTDVTDWAITTGNARCPRAPCWNGVDPAACPPCDKWAGYGTEILPPPAPQDPNECQCRPPVTWHIDTTDWLTQLPSVLCDP